jgi:hypothetical protein
MFSERGRHRERERERERERARERGRGREGEGEGERERGREGEDALHARAGREDALNEGRGGDTDMSLQDVELLMEALLPQCGLSAVFPRLCRTCSERLALPLLLLLLLPLPLGQWV